MATSDLGEATLVLSTDARKLIQGLEAARQKTESVSGTFDNAHRDLESKFSRKFSHVGIETFGKQLLHTVGITSDTRGIIGTLELGVHSLGQAFGVASGSLGLWVAGLGALAAIAFKVFENQKGHLEQITELRNKQLESLKTTQDLDLAMRSYATVVGELPAGLTALKIATQELDAAERQALASTSGRRMAALQGQIAVLKENKTALEENLRQEEAIVVHLERSGQAHETSSGLVRRYKDELEKLDIQIKTNQRDYELEKANVAAIGQGYQNTTDQLKKQAEAQKAADDAMRESWKTYKDFGPSIDFFVEKQKKAKAEADRLAGAMKGLQLATASSIGGMTASLLKGQQSFSNFVKNIIMKIGELIVQMAILKAVGFGIGGSFLGGVAGGLFQGGLFAQGGRPPRGQASVVGEQGPELFVPDVSGKIIPNNAISGSNVTFNQSISAQGMDFGSQEAARKFLRTAAALMRSGGQEALEFMRATVDQSNIQTGRAF